MRKLLLILTLFIWTISVHAQPIKAIVTMKHSSGSSSLLNGLVGYWKMDESSGNITDYSGNSNTGVANGTLTYSQSGVINTSIQFDGSTGYFNCGNNSSLQLSSAGTVSAWVYCTNTAVYNMVLSKGNSSTGLNGYNFLINSNGTLYFFVGNASTFSGGTSTATVSANTWHHVAATFDGTYINVYLDGSNVVLNAAQSVTPVSNVYSLSLGTRAEDHTGLFFNGKMDLIAIYNRAMSLSGIDSLYNSGAGKDYPFSFLPMKYLGNPYRSEPIGMIIPIEKYFADKPKNKIAA